MVESKSKNRNGNKELLSEKREDKALQKFKQALQDLILLLRKSLNLETVSLYWINHDRRQFVLETQNTICSNTIFQDRISFDKSFLDDYKSIKEPVTLEVGKEITELDLKHYYNQVPVRFIRLVPFINNGGTVALTILETSDEETLDNIGETVKAYINAMGNLLHTFMELNDLYIQQNEWVEYEETLDSLNSRLNNAQLLNLLVNQMQKYLSNGGVSVLGNGMGIWCTVLNADDARNALPIGLRVEENTIVKNALEVGEPVFTIHFNGNPKRMSVREPVNNGASLAIPLQLKDRRQALILAYDENPLVFKESTKHKLINLARVAALKIGTSYKTPQMLDNIFTNEFEAFIPEIIEQTVKSEIVRAQKQGNPLTWFGFLTITNISSIRTRLRLNELKQMQKDVIYEANPSNFGIPGIIGYHSDYVYSFIIQGNDKNIIDQWFEELRNRYTKPYKTNADQLIDISLTVGSTLIKEDIVDVQQVMKEAKTALSSGVRNNKNMIFKNF